MALLGPVILEPSATQRREAPMLPMEVWAHYTLLGHTRSSCMLWWRPNPPHRDRPWFLPPRLPTTPLLSAL